jgi:hypothetical protein
MGALILLESTLAKREGRVVKKKRKDPSRWWMSRKKRKESRTWGATEREFDRIARAERLIAKASFVSIGLILTGIDKCNTKITIDTIRDRDLFRVEN